MIGSTGVKGVCAIDEVEIIAMHSKVAQIHSSRRKVHRGRTKMVPEADGRMTVHMSHSHSFASCRNRSQTPPDATGPGDYTWSVPPVKLSHLDHKNALR